ncbi:Uncharacterised protein [Mycobacteroides abscessus subsp. abscessus]|nr:Uncharacterised protein [Mycobacteroides abscessus subsp. abscessus]
MEGRHLDLITKCCLDKSDWHFTVNIVSFTFKEFMAPDMEYYI